MKNQPIDIVPSITILVNKAEDALKDLINKQSTVEDYDARVALNTQIQNTKKIVEGIKSARAEAEILDQENAKLAKVLKDKEAKLADLRKQASYEEDWNKKEKLNEQINQLKAEIEATKAKIDKNNARLQELYQYALALLEGKAVEKPVNPSNPTNPTKPGHAGTQPSSTITGSTDVTNNGVTTKTTVVTKVTKKAGLPRTGETAVSVAALLCVALGASLLVVKKVKNHKI